MTVEEYAAEVEIVVEDHGARDRADWRVNYEKTRASITDRIAAAVAAAVAEERARCAAAAREALGKGDPYCCDEIAELIATQIEGGRSNASGARS